MRLYNKRQLVVVLAVLTAIAVRVVLRELEPVPRQPTGSGPQPAWVYQVSGACPQPGVYAFARPQTRAAVLACAGVRLPRSTDEPAAATHFSVHADGRITASPLSASVRLAYFQPFSLQTATADDLQLIPGIGPRLADRIVRWRDCHGPVIDLDRLQEVRGIGPLTMARVQSYLCP